MKQPILNQKISIFIFIVLLFVCGIQGMSFAALQFDEGDTTTREIAENTPAGTNIGVPIRYSPNSCTRIRLRGPDAGSFAFARVYRGMQLKTKSALDYETKDSYEVRVTVSGAGGSDTITVTINVTNVNEAPMFSEVNDEVDKIQRSVPENTVPGIRIGSPISATDPDGSEEVLTYNLKGIDANMFAIESGTGQLFTKEPLDYEAFESEPRSYFVKVTLYDGNPTSPETASTETDVRIDVMPVNEFPPTFIEGETTTREIREKSEIGQNVGDAVLATDADVGDTLTYSLIDADDVPFEIDSDTGQLTTNAILDRGTKPVYEVKVIVSDGMHTDSIVVTINVLPTE